MLINEEADLDLTQTPVTFTLEKTIMNPKKRKVNEIENNRFETVDSYGYSS